MKKKILIASLLKPVDDVRSYWKLSKSMSKTNKYAINIIGNAGKKLPIDSSVSIYPYPLKRNQFFKRWIRSMTLFIPFAKLKPDLLIITTYELLFSAIICKWITGCKLLYDIQEDYKANLSIYQSTIFRKCIGWLIRFWERIASRFVDHFWLAETCYKADLGFVKNKATIIENKAYYRPTSSRKGQPLRLLFSGTVSEYAGIKLAIYWYQRLRDLRQDTSLTIIGQVHEATLYEWLQKLQRTDDQLRLNVSFQSIPHNEIIEEINEANLGLISYQENIINRGKIPTKLYEYSRYRLPYLVIENTKWAAIGSRLGGAIAIDSTLSNPQKVIEKLISNTVYFPDVYPSTETWEDESIRMITSIETILNK